MRTSKKRIPAVSVVIPMYNCESFVPELLSMFADQSFTDFEVICVIDGATDGTEKAVEAFCKTDSRFRYIVRENGGAGAARNTGLDTAKGKYIVFPDADDEYGKDYLLKLYKAAEANEADMAVCNPLTVDFRTGEMSHAGGFNNKKLVEGKIYSSKTEKRIFRMIGIHVGGKMYRTGFIKRNELRFSEVRVLNDLYFSKAAVAAADSIVVVDEELVTIRRCINPKSITATRSRYSHAAIAELQKIYNWMIKCDMLETYISDYLWLVDCTFNYEMGNGVNHLFAEEAARMLNCDEPWKNMGGAQIVSVLSRAFGKKNLKPGNISSDIVCSDNTKFFKLRTENKTKMIELIKKVSVELYGKNLDEPEQEYVFYPAGKAITNITSNADAGISQAPQIPEITVVIPMYNCAAFAKEVLSQFANQSFSDFEVICVIDGATDNTEEVVSAFCNRDLRFRYTVRENGGAGAARNTGLDMAKGKYIIFADADDEYSPDYLKKLYGTAEKYSAQIVICRNNKMNTIINTSDVAGFDTKTLYENIPYSHLGIDDLYVKVNSRVTNKLYCKKFITDNGLRFMESKVANDTFFCFAALSVADRILFVKDILLNYRAFWNPDSLRGRRERYQSDALDALRFLYKWLKERSLLDVHGEDYMRSVNQSLIFEGRYKVFPKFISEAAHMLSEEEPWNSMTSEEMLKYLEEALLAQNALRRYKALCNISPDVTENDIQLSYLLNKYRNMVHMAELIRQVLKERYGKEFPVQNNDSEIPDKKAGAELIIKEKCTPKVSVVIPVYNVEKYIDNCIISLKNQSLKNLEYIFVDDKSADASMEKVNDFAASDNRVRIFNCEENKGAGYARNIGITQAHGEYLAFLDPDDYVAFDFYERLYRKAVGEGGERHDIVKGCRRKESVDGDIIEDAPNLLNEKIRKGQKEGQPLYCCFSYEHTTALYSRHLFDNADVRYSTARKSEDVTFLFKVCNKTNDIVFDDDAIYSYVQRSGSATKIVAYEYHLDGIKEMGEIIKWIRDKRKMNRYDYQYLSYKFSARLRAYKKDMEKSQTLKDNFEEYLVEFFSAIKLADNPCWILDGKKELKQLYDSLPDEKKIIVYSKEDSHN